MSINRLFSISRQSLAAQTARINIAGQNIAHAGDPGYARRRLGAGAIGAGAGGVLMRGDGLGGMGVRAGSVERMKDALLENAAREAHTGFAESGERARLLASLEGVFGADGGTLSRAFDGFFQSLTDLANDPTGSGARQAVLARAEDLAGTFGRMDGAIVRLQRETREALGQGVSEANDLLARLAALDAPIRAARTAGHPDLDAEQQRDGLLVRLAEFMPIDVAEGSDGLRVSTGGLVLVQGDTAQTIHLPAPPAAPRPEVSGRALPEGGALGAHTAVLNGPLAETRSALNTLAADLAAQANAVHETGYGLDGGTGRALFSGTSAASLALALTDPSHLAAAGSPDAPGDTASVLALLDLRDGFDTKAAGIVASVGEGVRAARAEASAQGALADHLGALAAAVSGVSLDEEMTRLIEAQQAFAASARVLQTAQDMMDTVLRL